MSSDNTIVTFTPGELTQIQILGQIALQNIQDAPQGTYPVGVWAPMYNFILTVMNAQGLAGTTQAYWFAEAGYN